MVRKGIKFRSAADACQVHRTTLRRHLQKLLHKPARSKHLGKMCLLGPEKELELVNHITEFERKGFPLTTMDIQKLAYEIVVRNNIKHSFNNVTQTADSDWWIGFKKHQNILTICKPQAVSIQRETHLNKSTVERYFQVL